MEDDSDENQKKDRPKISKAIRKSMESKEKVGRKVKAKGGKTVVEQETENKNVSDKVSKNKGGQPRNIKRECCKTIKKQKVLKEKIIENKEESSEIESLSKSDLENNDEENEYDHVEKDVNESEEVEEEENECEEVEGDKDICEEVEENEKCEVEEDENKCEELEEDEKGCEKVEDENKGEELDAENKSEEDENKYEEVEEDESGCEELEEDENRCEEVEEDENGCEELEEDENACEEVEEEEVQNENESFVDEDDEELEEEEIEEEEEDVEEEEEEDIDDDEEEEEEEEDIEDEIGEEESLVERDEEKGSPDEAAKDEEKTVCNKDDESKVTSNKGKKICKEDKKMDVKKQRSHRSLSSDHDSKSDNSPKSKGGDIIAASQSSRSSQTKLKKDLGSTSVTKDKNVNSDEKGSRESLSEIEEMEDSSSPQRRELETTDTETDDSDEEDFPTEGLLKELHFLNASCERPSFSKSAVLQGHRTPKKQKKYDAKGENSRANTPSIEKNNGSSLKKNKRKISLPKKHEEETDSETKKFKQSTSTPLKATTKALSTDEEESDEGSLRIVGDEENPRKRKATSPSKSKKRAHTMDSGDVPLEVIELIQSGIDEVLEEKAERTHLTAIHVRNIIKNVMTDENVLAMVRNTVLGINTEAVSSAVYEPTLTRAKTKEIIQQQADGTGKGSIWAELSKTKTATGSGVNPETHALVTTDFPDEDEDDEYTPEGDEHMNSDDESYISTCLGSSMGSPTTPVTPSTPQSRYTPCSMKSLDTPHTTSDVNSPAQCSDKRIQLLKHKSAQRILNFEQPLKKEELVSQRTRSKLPLTETPLECLEMAFNPPDVTNDMFETEVLDDDWKTFLIDFIHPLKNAEGAEDEDADPEYNILEDKEDANDLREEMRGDRAVQISKKEINELLTELLGTLDSDEEGTGPADCDNEGTKRVKMHLSQHLIHNQKKKPPPVKKIEPVIVTETGPPSNAIWVEIVTAKFTSYQLEVLRSQMVQHCQLLTTTVLMCKGLPLAEMEESATRMLEEMKVTGDESDYSNSFFQPFNLEAALSTVKIYKEKYPEQPLIGWRKNTCIELSVRVTQAILESSAFPFPQLLPQRLFNDPNKVAIKKASFVPSEDMLIVMGLVNQLLPENQLGKNMRKQQSQLFSALNESMKDSALHKTLDQVRTRMKNMRGRIKEYSINGNPLAIYLQTGKVDIPSAAVEPILPCVPCRVREFPQHFLEKPWKKIVIRKQKLLCDAAKMGELDQENLKQELMFGGVRALQQSIQKMVIIQANGCSTQVMLPTTLAAIAPLTTVSYLPATTMAVMPTTITPVTSLYAAGSAPIVSSSTASYSVPGMPSIPATLTANNVLPSVSAPVEVNSTTPFLIPDPSSAVPNPSISSENVQSKKDSKASTPVTLQMGNIGASQPIVFQVPSATDTQPIIFKVPSMTDTVNVNTKKTNIGQKTQTKSW